ncbi:MAG: response regulator [Planctomycetota bacterium]
MPKILLIDDDPLMLDFLIPALQYYGFELEAYLSALQALERFKTEKFDLVITDLYMQDLDGRSFTVQLKEIRNETPVIIMTAYPSSESILDLGTLGISDYITKPFDIEKLVKSIQTALSAQTPT